MVGGDVGHGHHQRLGHARVVDQPLLDALEKKGFRLNFGEDGTGWQFKYLTRGGGYYFNVGCSELIIAGKVPVVEFPPMQIKLALAGHGHAEKDAVLEAVMRELDLELPPRPDDAADALAVALTGWFQR